MPRTRTTFEDEHEVSDAMRIKISRKMKDDPAMGRPNLLELKTGKPNELGMEALLLRSEGFSIRAISAELERAHGTKFPKSVVGRLVKEFCHLLGTGSKARS